MSEDNFIAKLKLRNFKLFSAKEIKITPAALEKLARQCYREGEKTASAGKSLFEQIFGTK